MIRNILTALILLPIALAIVLFSVGNRAPVTIGFDPFAAEPPMFAFAMPLFLLLLLVLIAGVILGGVSAWTGQSHWRRRARRLAAELKVSRAEADKLRRQVESAPQPRPQSSIAAIAYRHPHAA
ncbi:MAG: lipopolysaccharide assembly protein LapA domain-containing protein [Alphaproteobacteria bacterium]